MTSLPTESPTPTAGPAPAPDIAPPAGPDPTVLIVDDEPDQLGLLTAYFTRAGCTVIALSTGEQALALPSAIPLDLMLLDLLLPRINGWELTKRLRERHPGCPIAITSILEPEHYPQADAVLPKPVTKAQIRQLLATTIPRWEPR
ncbi:response regulator [Nakamurella sp. PAMC28650]|uniref:response regulator n=1 Tax=Nakamurella sp. PAMC28650 TaxID=2762325 RepID=UPI00164DEE92|nr:response regulator [Nakamurella sp. PAMC28650]QNK82537.1 response regulator [Nakamurella sp. PAMC28650]